MSNRADLRATSAVALDWYRASVQVSTATFLSSALDLLQRHVPFDGAIWARCEAPGHCSHGCVESLHLRRLAQSSVSSLRALLFEEFSPGEAASPVQCRPLRLSRESGSNGGQGQLREVCEREDIAHALGLRADRTLDEGRQWMLLTRSSHLPPFELRQARWLEVVGAHLLQACAISHVLSQREPEREREPRADVGWRARALVDRSGLVWEQDGAWAGLLRREWPAWDGHVLPPELAATLPRTDEPVPTRGFMGKRISISVSSTPDADRLSVIVRPTLDILTPRETDVARRYSRGQTHRQIAQALGLAPATVRAHLRQLYRKLRVQNKLQLAAVMRAID